jgi:hypothetical protein
MPTETIGMSEIPNPQTIVGGDYVESSFGVIMGVAFAAGVTGSGGLLALACGGGLMFLLLDAWL